MKQLRVDAGATPFIDETVSSLECPAPDILPASLPIPREYLNVACDVARSLIVP